MRARLPAARSSADDTLSLVYALADCLTFYACWETIRADFLALPRSTVFP